MVPLAWADRVEQIIESLMPLPLHFQPEEEIIYLSKRSELMDFVKSTTRKEKSIEVASEYMKEGDNRFRSKSFEDCLQLYSKSIFYSPNSSIDLSHAYIKRAFVLLHLGHYSEANRDLEMALSNGFSRNSFLENVIQRLNSEHYKQAEASLFEILKKLELLPVGQYENEGCKDHYRRINSFKQTCPTVRNHENPDFPSSSNCLQVVYSTDKGRYVVAKSDIKAGDVLFVEKPFAFATEANNCSWCGEDNIAPIPCIDCPDTYFCSVKCRNHARESHRWECGFFTVLHDTGTGYLALKIILNAASDFEELKPIVQSLSSKEKLKENPVVFSKNPYENVYYLQTNLDKMIFHQVLAYALTATFLALYLVHHTKYALHTDGNVKLIAEILLHHIAQIQCNAHTIVIQKALYRDETRLFGSEFVKIGAGIYPSVSMMNHSCEPSVINSFLGTVLITRACKDISKGEEVFNNYGADSRETARAIRQEILKDIYYFDCKCSSCSQDVDPCDLLDTYRCEGCFGPLARYMKEDERKTYCDYDHLICLNCENFQVLTENHKRILYETESCLEVGKKILRQPKDAEKALPLLLNAWKLGRSALYKFHENLLALAILMGDCFYIMGDYKRCISVFKCTILSVEARFGRLSKEFAIEGKKLSDSIQLHIEETLGNKSTEEELSEFKSLRGLALLYYDAAENIFKLFYGDDYPLLYEIKRDLPLKSY